MTTDVKQIQVPKTFVLRRIHSLMGLWFLIFLTEHLFTNSQVTLFFGNDGLWFVESVDWIRGIPYLQAVEVGLLGIPILYHSCFGIYYMFTSKSNSRRGNGTKPAMKYQRNRAYTWQRYSAWILLIGIVLHVVQMRFFDYPYKYRFGNEVKFYTKLKVDPKLYEIADRLNVSLYNQRAIEREKDNYDRLKLKISLVEEREKELIQEIQSTNSQYEYNSEMDHLSQSLQKFGLMKEHINGLESRKIDANEVIAVSKSFGSLELLSVRETFQSIIMCLLYTIFVAAAVFHGFNGLWTFLITWGLILSKRAHSTGKTFSIGLMFIVGFLGFMSIWGTFFWSL